MSSLPYSPLPRHILQQDSLPFCVFRNKERYATSVDVYRGVLWSPHSSEMMASRAWDCARHKLYNTAASGMHSDDVPPRILYDVALQDMADTRALERRRQKHYMPSTLKRMLHNDQSLVVHAAGKYLDELIIRYADECDLLAGEKALTGFTLPLGRGGRVEGIYSCGAHAVRDSCRLLVKVAGSVIYHLRTVEVNLVNPSRSFRSTDVILEPRDSYQLPREVLCMCGGPQPMVLCAGGALYGFDPMRGLSTHSSTPLPFMSSDRGGVVKLEQTLHPMLSYISCDAQLHLHDLRAPPTLLAAATTGSIECILQHGKRSEFFFLSCDSELCLMDSRYCKQPLCRRPLPEAHTHMVFQAGEELHPSRGAGVDMVLGGSSGARQVLMHTLQLEGAAMHGGTGDDGDDENGDGDGNSVLNWCLLSPKLSPFGASSAVLWTTRGAPVVDRSSALVTLGGLAICPLRPPDGKDRIIHRLQSSDSDSARQRRENEGRAQKHQAYLFQQSSLGDVYMQRLSLWHSRGGEAMPPVQTSLPCGLRVHDVVSQDLGRKISTKAPGLMLVSDSLLWDKEGDGLLRYPVTSDNIVPSMEEREIGRFDLVKMSSPPKRPQKSKRVMLSACFTNISLFLTERLRSGPMSLYEAYSYLADISDPTGFPSLHTLLSRLRQEQGMQQYLLPFSQELVDKVCRSDLLRVKVRGRACDGDDEDDDDALCKCADGLVERVGADSELTSRLEPCGERSCLLPHLIMFRLASSADSSGGLAVTQPFLHESIEGRMNKKQRQRLAADPKVLLSGDILNSLQRKWAADTYV